MKKIELFVMKSCPYCLQALRWQDELIDENPDYGKINIEIIDENQEAARAAQYDYYYVPTYYVGSEKLHEGAACRADIKAVLDAALTE